MMGLYDWIYIDIKCPNCNNKVNIEFQTYDLSRCFYEFNLGDKLDSRTPLSLLGICPECYTSINAWGNIKHKILDSIEVFRYSIDLKKHIIIKKGATKQ